MIIPGLRSPLISPIRDPIARRSLTPAALGDALFLWARPDDDAVTLNGSNVTSMTGLSGRAHDTWAQATEAREPRLVADAIDGHNALEFVNGGSVECLDSDTLDAHAAPMTVWCVAKAPGTWANNATAYGGADAIGFALLDRLGELALYSGAFSAQKTLPSAGTWFLDEATFNGNRTRHMVGNAGEVSGNVGTTLATKWRLGALSGAAPVGQWAGQIAELIAMTGRPTRAQRAIVLSYLSQRYPSLSIGATLALPTGPRLCVIAGGQSNMVGTNTLAGRPAGYPANPTKILTYCHDDTTQTALDPIDDMTGVDTGAAWYNATTGVGPTLQFADDVITGAGATSAIIAMVAKGGSTLVTSWAPASALRVEFLAQAAAVLRAGDTPVFVWYQGESDATFDEATAIAVTSRTQAIIDEHRTQGETITGNTMIALIVRLPETNPNEGTYPYWDAVRTAQALLDNGTDTFVVDAPDGPFEVDGIHLTVGAQIALGESLAAKYLLET